MRPRVFGYLRSHGRSGTIAEQRKAVERWYWKYGVEEGLEWESWVVDRHVRRLNFFERPKLQEKLAVMVNGDWLVGGWFGALFGTVDDGIEGLPGLLNRGIRVQVCRPRLELGLRDLELIRMLRTEWYVDPVSNKTPKPLGVKQRDYPRLAVAEMSMMRFCFQKQFLEGKTQEEVLREIKEYWRTHIRLKVPFTDKFVRNAAYAYYDILEAQEQGRKMPHWLQAAKKRGFFTERLSDITEASKLRFDRLGETFKKGTVFIHGGAESGGEPADS